MNNTLSMMFAAVIAATAPVLATGGHALALDQACLSDREIYSQVEAGTLMSLEDVLRANGVDRSTQVLSVQVCDDSGGPAYYVGVISSSGEAKTLVLPASQ